MTIKGVHHKDIYEAGQVEINLGGGWRKADPYDNEDQMPITQLYKKLLEFNNHLFNLIQLLKSHL